MTKQQQRLQRAALGAFIAGVVVAGLALQTPLTARIDAVVFDTQMRTLRAVHETPADDVVVVGIDEATVKALPDPFAMAHSEIGAALQALAQAGARLIVLDVILPDRSFDHLRPGLDVALFRGLRTARDAGLIVAVQPEQGGVRNIFAPFVEAAGEQSFGLAVFEQDVDGVVRRFQPRLGKSGEAVPTVTGRIAEVLQRPAHGGWIDWSMGARFDYLPLHQLTAQARRGEVDRIGERVRGKVVILGSVEPYVDRVAQPIQLAAWEPATATPPGVLLHAQAARTVLAGGMIRVAPGLASILAIVAFAAVAFVRRLDLRWLLLGAAMIASFIAGAWLLTLGWNIAWASAWVAGLVAVTARTAFDAWLQFVERQRIEQTFGGYVSPQVLRAILDGRLDLRGGRADLAFLFADLRGFTAMSERDPPERVLAVLNRYYAAITPALHRHGGTIDNFRGDGVMVMFGAPEPIDQPAGAAITAAHAMLEAVHALNIELKREGVEPLTVGIGIACGPAVYGDLGSDDRKDFTALGDAVNIAARLQDLAKELERSIVITQFAFDAAGLPAEVGAGYEPLGRQALKGRGAIEVVAWPRRGS